MSMVNLWPPYFSLKDNIPSLKVKGANGSKIFLESGKILIDGISSWWSVCHGYMHPHIIYCMQRQLEKMPHIMFGGISHAPAEELSQKLINFIEEPSLTRVFFSDSGSTAVEAGLKMALQIFYQQNKPEKKNILYFKNGYHGDTIGALSVSESLGTTSHEIFPGLTNKICFAVPSSENELEEFRIKIESVADKVACCIIEPILQAAGGMILTDPALLTKVWNILRKNKILIIADECATGFYRLGEKFAFKKIGIAPDILILGKALTAGYIPFAATIATEYIFQEICRKNRFYHGPTFMANPLACSAAIASIEIFMKENYKEKVSSIEKFFSKFFKDNENRILGGTCSFDIPSEKVMQIRKYVALEKTNSFLRPFGNILYAMPPLNIPEQDLKIICNDIKSFL